MCIEGTAETPFSTEQDEAVTVDAFRRLPNAPSSCDIDILFSVAERAVSEGRISEAEAIIAAPLRAILSDIRAQQPANRRTRGERVKRALRLAETTGDVEWLDFVLDLFTTQDIECTETEAFELTQVRKRVGHPDPEYLQSYLALLRTKAPTHENLRVIALLESMRGAVNER